MGVKQAYTLLNSQREGYRRRTLKQTWTLVLSVSSVFAVLWYQDRGSPSSFLPFASDLFSVEDESGVCRFTGAQTFHLGGEPGFQTFENVGYFNRTFYFFGSNGSLPPEEEIMSGTSLKVVSDGSFIPDACFGGTTLLSNEGADPSAWWGLWHYYHLTIENILGGFAGGALAMPQPAVPDRLAIPWVEGWHDRWGMNDAVTTAVFGQEIIEKAQWELMSNERLFFSKVIFVDRWAAHRKSKLVEVWHKMPIQVFETLLTRPNSARFFDAARSRLRVHFNVPWPRKPRIAYIDRQSTPRKLPDEAHNKLLGEMKSLAAQTNWEFSHLVLEDMTPEEQFRQVSQASVMIGVHGNGLTHLMWLEPSSAVIELFPSHVFQRDYQTAASALGFDYTAISGSRVVTPEEWEADPGNKNGHKLKDGTPVDVSIPLVMEHLAAAVEARTSQ